MALKRTEIFRGLVRRQPIGLNVEFLTVISKRRYCDQGKLFGEVTTAELGGELAAVHIGNLKVQDSDVEGVPFVHETDGGSS
ncbi:hypothetical protein IMCC26134_06905 [Verrucomicrobia bacterium IMCC26134]|jgi:hypothetical protein|nr:hypothetical protein IMCC26134_06905 [Verrucomicrobia bacterium IMCC26134]